MSYQVYSNNGYGTEIHYGKITAERFIAFMRNHKALKDFYDTFEQTELNDMIDEDVVAVSHEYEGSNCCMYGIMSMLADVICDEKNIALCACDDFDGREYLLYIPYYPWATLTSEEKAIKSEEDIVNFIAPYLTELYGEEVSPDEFGYCEVANGG